MKKALLLVAIIVFFVSSPAFSQDVETVEMDWEYTTPIDAGFTGWSLEKQAVDESWSEFLFIDYDPSQTSPYNTERDIDFPVGTVNWCFRLVAKNVLGDTGLPSEAQCLENTYYGMPGATINFHMKFKVNAP